MKTRKNRDMSIYWINLDRATERRNHMKKMLLDKRLESIPKIRFSALDSKKIELGDYFDIKRDILSVNFRVSKNEYACLLSHLETIRTFSESEYSTALILEDDVIFNKHTDTFQDVIDNAPKDWDIIRLSYNCFTKKTVTKKYDPFKVICNSTNCVANWGAQAYLIHKKAAKQIIAELYDKKYKLENDMFHVADYLLFHKLKTYTYNKKLFDIQKKNISYIKLCKNTRF